MRAESPNLAGRTLYRHIVSQHLGLDPQAANTIVWRAEQSFAAWPNERDVQFRDVVLYLAVDEYLKSHVAREGTQINMGNVVTRIIPTDW